MNFDTLIRGGTVVTEDAELPLDVGISGERIAGLLNHGTQAQGRNLVDATGCYVLPGSIDTHTHIEWPFSGERSRDTFAAATSLAAAGGTTCVIDFVPTPRGTSPLVAAEARLALADGNSVVDYSFHPILSSASAEVLRQIPQLIRDGFASFKIYTTYAENRLDDGDIWAVMKQIAAQGGVAGFHAENHEMLEWVLRDMREQEQTRVRDFPRSRPALAEVEAISMVALFAKRLEAPVWIYHLSGGEALETVEDARLRGTAIQGETCTHYLAFDDSVFTGEDPWRFVITPPIRNAESRARLWRGVAERSLSGIASDHTAYGKVHKGVDADDFTKIAPGAPGIGVRFPILWSEGVANGRVTASDVASVASARPARALGLWPRKGVVAVGSDADLVVMDPNVEWTLPPPDGENGSDYSLYSGRRVQGRIRATLVRGAVVARDGVAVGRPGHGRFVPRTIEERSWRQSRDSLS